MDKTILCIIRASTEKQETESQKKELVDYCKAKGFVEDEMAFIEVAGASARKLNKKYIQMLEDIKHTLLSSPTIKAVALWDLNRLGRVESKLHEMKEFFVEHKIQVYCKAPEFTLLNEDGTASDAGGIVFSVFASIVKHDTDEMFAKMKRGKDRNRALGIYTGGQIKFGYVIDESRHFYICEEEAKVIRLIFDLYSTGKYSFYKLVEELNARGITKKGQKITFNMIQNALSDEAYYNGKLPIITKELYDKCAAIKDSTVAVKRTKESRNVNFAVGLLKCHCGQNFIATGDFYTCYSKVNNRRRDIEKCDAPVMRRSIMDGLLWFVTSRIHQNFLMQQDSTSIAQYKEKQAELNLKVSKCQNDLEDIKARTEKLQDDYYVEGGMSEAQFQKRLSGLKSKKQQTESLITNHLNEIEEIERVIRQLELPREERYIESIQLSDLDTGNIEDRKKIKDLMFTHIEKATIEKFMDGKHKCTEITIVAKSGLTFTFIYDTWLNSHRKGECNIFYEGKPLYLINGDIVVLNKEVVQMVKDKIGLPLLTDEELDKATRNYIQRDNK